MDGQSGRLDTCNNKSQQFSHFLEINEILVEKRRISESSEMHPAITLNPEIITGTYSAVHLYNIMTLKCFK